MGSGEEAGRNRGEKIIKISLGIWEFPCYSTDTRRRTTSTKEEMPMSVMEVIALLTLVTAVFSLGYTIGQTKK